MLLNIFFKNLSELVLSSQDDITVSLIDQLETPSAYIVESKTFQFQDTSIYEYIQNILEKYADYDIDIRCVLRETDVISCTTNKYSKRKVNKLLKNRVTKAGHGLVLDLIYNLEDCDYYIYSLVNDKLYKRVKVLQNELKTEIETVTENQLVLSVLLKRGRSKNSTGDCAILNNKQSHYVFYAATESGIPYRILNLENSAEIAEVSKCTSIKKGMFIDCSDKMSEFDINIALMAGTIRSPRDALLVQHTPSQQVKCEERCEELLLEPNSVEYKKYKPRKFLKFSAKVLMAVTLLVVITLGGYIWASNGDNLNPLSDIGLKLAARLGRMPYVDKEDYEYKLEHDKAIYIVKSSDLEILSTDFVATDMSAVLGIELNTGSVTQAVVEVIELLEAEGYTVQSNVLEQSGNIILICDLSKND